MQSFLARFGSEIKGVLSGVDRVRFRGTIRWLASERGVGTYSKVRYSLNETRSTCFVRRGWASMTRSSEAKITLSSVMA